MPNHNGRGPAGEGPMTGRGLGPCAGSTAGGGRVFRRNGTPRGISHRQADIDSLQGEIRALREEVAAMRSQLSSTTT